MIAIVNTFDNINLTAVGPVGSDGPDGWPS